MKTIIAYPAFKNRRTNPYQALLYEGLQERDWRVLDLDAGVKRLVRPDILHLHWPEGFAFHRELLKSCFRSMLLLALVRLYRMLGARVVWTAHNLRSHEAFHPKLEAWFWKRLLNLMDGWIALNRATVEIAVNRGPLAKLPHAVIPHGLYPQPQDISAPSQPAEGGQPRLLFFGKLRPYKEIPLLVDAFSRLPEGLARLTIAGQSHDTGLTKLLLQKSRTVPGLEVRIGFLEEEELTGLLRNTTAVVIPYAGSLNSGVLFQALSYGKPVLVPDTPVFREVAADFPSGRISCFKDPLRSEDLAQFVGSLGTIDGPGTDTFPEAYSWSHIVAEHDRFFQQLKRGVR